MMILKYAMLLMFVLFPAVVTANSTHSKEWGQWSNWRILNNQIEWQATCDNSDGEFVIRFHNYSNQRVRFTYSISGGQGGSTLTIPKDDIIVTRHNFTSLHRCGHIDIDGHLTIEP